MVEGGYPPRAQAESSEEIPLNERAAYQEAVCVAAGEGREAGIKAFEGFVEQYPYSTLIHAAVLRIRRMNEQVPTERCERLWKRARALQEKKQREERIAASRCGPECLAAVLRHYGIEATVDGLAREAGTGEHGTTLDGLARAARRRGLSAVGVKVTPEGLRAQPLPAIALAGEHYVLLEAVDRAGVVVTDRGRQERLDWKTWSQRWSGVIPRLEPRQIADSRLPIAD